MNMQLCESTFGKQITWTFEYAIREMNEKSLNAIKNDDFAGVRIHYEDDEYIGISSNLTNRMLSEQNHKELIAVVVFQRSTHDMFGMAFVGGMVIKEKSIFINIRTGMNACIEKFKKIQSEAKKQKEKELDQALAEELGDYWFEASEIAFGVN